MLGFDTQTLERRALARNEVLFRQGDPVTAIYFLETGRLRLDRRTFDGRTLILGTTSAGRFFVEAALFADIFHCDAVATEPSQVCIYPKPAVLEALRTDSSNAMSFLALMAHEVIEVRQQIEIMKVRSATERVMLYLDLNAGPDGRTVDLQGQLQDVAGELGLTREALYRTLASLERAGAIEREGTRILLKKSPGDNYPFPHCGHAGYLASLNTGVAWWETMSQRPSWFSNTFVTKASKSTVLPSLRSNWTFSIPTAHATFPFVRT